MHSIFMHNGRPLRHMQGHAENLQLNEDGCWDGGEKDLASYTSLGQADAGDEAKLMTKLAPEWVRTCDPVIRSPARYRWTTAPALTCVCP